MSHQVKVVSVMFFLAAKDSKVLVQLFAIHMFIRAIAITSSINLFSNEFEASRIAVCWCIVCFPVRHHHAFGFQLFLNLAYRCIAYHTTQLVCHYTHSHAVFCHDRRTREPFVWMERDNLLGRSHNIIFSSRHLLGMVDGEIEHILSEPYLHWIARQNLRFIYIIRYWQ